MSSPPTTLGQYQIIREIARSNDIVYEAYDPLMNRRVAVKELSMPSGSTSQQQDDRISRFKREAQAAGTLNHPNIMTVYSFAEDAGRTFMAMEYLDGQTLRNEIDTKGVIPAERAVEIASSVLAGLEHAHSKGVIHRDIKPDNIQILSNDTVKITDFGIARLTFQPNLTIDGQVFGTPSYMSPEQVVGRDIDARSDLFSVGVMLYEMLVGKKPFSGDSVVSTTYAIMNTEAERPSSISWPLWSVIDRALSKAPSMRYAGASDMDKALHEAMSPNGGVLPLDPQTPSSYNPNPNPYAQQIPGASAQNPFINAGAPPPIPISAPYNPYAPPDPNANPYAAQYQQQQQAPAPLTYPYNPFAANAGAAPPMPGGMVAPIYYPPPPKIPLLKPETSLFLKKLLLAFLVFGTLGTLLVVLIQFSLDVVGQGPRQQKIAQARTDADRADQAQKAGDLSNAENDLDDAQGSDPHNPTYSASQGKLLWNAAAASRDPQQQAELYVQSGKQFKLAYDDETNSTLKKDEATNYVSAALNAAEDAVQTGDSDLIRETRESLESARAYALNDPTLLTQIDELLPKMRA